MSKKNSQNHNIKLQSLLVSAKKGEPIAQYNLGVIYFNGMHGAKKDYHQSFEWYSKSAIQGFAPSQTELAKMYRDGNGVNQDGNNALKWFTKAAEQDDTHAKYNLGAMFLNGEAISADYSRALYWFQEAAKNGHASAQYNLGIIFRDGKGTQKDGYKAVEWFKLAAGQGDVDSQYNLAMMYLTGEGNITPDSDKAMYWLRLAAKNGDQQAQNWLDNFNLGTTLQLISLKNDPSSEEKNSDYNEDVISLNDKKNGFTAGENEHQNNDEI